VLERAFGVNSRYYATFASFNWQFSGSAVITVDELMRYGDPTGVMAAKHQDAYRRQLDSAKGLLEAARDELAADIETDVNEAAPAASLPETRFEVFLSYASTDSELAHELKESLEEEGISCFLLRRICRSLNSGRIRFVLRYYNLVSFCC